MHVHALICFSSSPGQGNPALVIEGAPRDSAARQALARERNTTCVFLDEDGAGTQVDFFYPHMRSPLCLHATLAVAAVLFARPGAPATIAVETALKGQRLELAREGAGYFVKLAPQAVPAIDVTPAQVAALLAAPAIALPSPPRLASVGSPKLLVEVADTDALYALAPDLAAIADWGHKNGVSGIYAWCRRTDGDYEGRNFNHLDPALEDSATGVAAGALSVALGQGLTLRQGRATGRDCLIRTRVDGAAVLVGGAAEPAGQTSA
ncbi:PhzF family phenazine biosynthesis protein [Herbaspirillum sp. SJZ107]|uniref:PhzF family phenazine biosynthesis protein n=1 Tax=Herbaspirillum sp. SJZ107 TaxID=2572881 RepID=UPI00114F7DDE|nr:PhzF family phenazine biosynthesis protein [Herbaspirillum sp. SJZ107]TQK07685.1 PhzF family phenazine biosynthesis protein [Herbaspirillum sp. SJZ107]